MRFFEFVYWNSGYSTFQIHQTFSQSLQDLGKFFSKEEKMKGS